MLARSLQLGDGLSAKVTALATINGTLFAGGEFDCSGSLCGLTHTAQWNGTAWLPMGAGLPSATIKFQIYAGTLYALAGTASNANIYVWSVTGQAWTVLTAAANAGSFAVWKHGPASTDITVVTGAGTAVKLWNATSGWSTVATVANGVVNAVAYNGRNVYYGGSFYTTNGVNAFGFAYYDRSRGQVYGLSKDLNVAMGASGAPSAIARYQDNVVFAGNFDGIVNFLDNDYEDIALWRDTWYEGNPNLAGTRWNTSDPVPVPRGATGTIQPGQWFARATMTGNGAYLTPSVLTRENSSSPYLIVAGEIETVDGMYTPGVFLWDDLYQRARELAIADWLTMTSFFPQVMGYYSMPGEKTKCLLLGGKLWRPYRPYSNRGDKYNLMRSCNGRPYEVVYGDAPGYIEDMVVDENNVLWVAGDAGGSMMGVATVNLATGIWDASTYAVWDASSVILSIARFRGVTFIATTPGMLDTSSCAGAAARGHQAIRSAAGTMLRMLCSSGAATCTWPAVASSSTMGPRSRK